MKSHQRLRGGARRPEVLTFVPEGGGAMYILLFKARRHSHQCNSPWHRWMEGVETSDLYCCVIYFLCDCCMEWSYFTEQLQFN